MKYKIKNKTEIYTKYADVVFAPKEEKFLELEIVYEHENFDIEKQEKLKRKKLKKKEVKDDRTYKKFNRNTKIN